MKIKYISALITLSAGAVVAVMGLIAGTPTEVFIRNVLLTLIVFFLFGLMMEKIIASALAPAASKDEFEVFENIEEILRREEEYDEKYNDGKNTKREVKRIPLG